MKLLTLLAALPLCAQTYDIQPAEGSRFALEIYKTGLMSGKKHLFLFERYAGTLQYDANSPESSKVDLTIEAASFAVKDDWVSAKQAIDVRKEAEGPNGLDVAKFKQMRFVSQSIVKTGAGFDVRGTLTIRGVEKPVTVAVQMKPGVFTGKAEVKLKDYGIKPPSAALGAVGTRNEMDVTFTLIAAPRR